MKKRFFALIGVLFFMAAGSGLYAQQITKFGVVDTAKVYNAYFRNSAPVRNYEKKKAEFQEEINKYTDELQKLQLKKLEYEKADNDAQAQRVQAEISKKSEFLVEYTNAKNIELESIQKSLQSSDAFYKKLYDSLAKIAESGGYSMILSLQQANAILWYSSSVDITEQVIADLGL
ncbi:OmpH family outer membrane protein [Treponema porcinum]|uniref:Periplasmic chaperone for outer membrane proteins Skp n=1 Tax=Treponema porcinum TaxID=261392 RepID=A0A1T4KVT0_TREPO|nr:OmpH family outer membrane protein [Treponema porcinum]MCI6984109.1 OmpH family outer membrane protein [Treponema porcinum]MCI7534235.1 OmpH family outer membrane protein [Treponema porcinum]MCI7545326.1 OmpH family outer membrane protein [Treponema porcinum]MDY5046765.1 OmpH family outer membrane protein [Treponema porcinum]MDY5633935.1 OmpH family outer membrane protein [Treponema porcinum]